jgi:hypothetical protein
MGVGLLGEKHEWEVGGGRRRRAREEDQAGRPCCSPMSRGGRHAPHTLPTPDVLFSRSRLLLYLLVCSQLFEGDAGVSGEAGAGAGSVPPNHR